jgi:hypothetical protein
VRRNDELFICWIQIQIACMRKYHGRGEGGRVERGGGVEDQKSQMCETEVRVAFHRCQCLRADRQFDQIAVSAFRPSILLRSTA